MRKYTQDIQKLHEEEAARLHEAVYEIPVKGDWGSLNNAEKWVPVSKELYDQWKGKKRMDGKVSEDSFANVGDKFEQTWKSTQVFQDPKNKPANINTGDKITISKVIDPNTFIADFGGVKFTITTDELAKFKRTK